MLPLISIRMKVNGKAGTSKRRQAEEKQEEAQEGTYLRRFGRKAEHMQQDMAQEARHRWTERLTDNVDITLVKIAVSQQIRGEVPRQRRVHQDHFIKVCRTESK